MPTPASPGYSGTSLARKLGIVPSSEVFVAGAPADYPQWLAPLPTGVRFAKKASKVVTSITEDVIREVALPLGHVDVKVCAVSEIWSGLKLVVRKELRRSRAA